MGDNLDISLPELDILDLPEELDSKISIWDKKILPPTLMPRRGLRQSFSQFIFLNFFLLHINSFASQFYLFKQNSKAKQNSLSKYLPWKIFLIIFFFFFFFFF